MSTATTWQPLKARHRPLLKLGPQRKPHLSSATNQKTAPCGELDGVAADASEAVEDEGAAATGEGGGSGGVGGGYCLGGDRVPALLVHEDAVVEAGEEGVALPPVLSDGGAKEVDATLLRPGVGLYAMISSPPPLPPSRHSTLPFLGAEHSLTSEPRKATWVEVLTLIGLEIWPTN